MASSSRQPATRRPRIVVAATGCIAAVNFGHLCERLKEWADVQAVVTERAKEFIPCDSLPRNLTMYSNASELTFWMRLGDTAIHIELQKWADMLVIAPLSANTLAKIAAGICDNLLTSVVKVWDCEAQPLFVAPAMSTPMWMNSTTEKHLAYLEDEMGVRLIRHKSSEDSGPGSMAEVTHICNTIHLVWDNLNHKPPSKPGESNEPDELGEPDESGESDEPDGSGESDEPDESGELDEPDESGESDEPDESSEPDEADESGKPGESDKPSEAGESDKPGESGKRGEYDEPDKSGESGEP